MIQACDLKRVNVRYPTQDTLSLSLSVHVRTALERCNKHRTTRGTAFVSHVKFSLRSQSTSNSADPTPRAPYEDLDKAWCLRVQRPLKEDLPLDLTGGRSSCEPAYGAFQVVVTASIGPGTRCGCGFVDSSPKPAREAAYSFTPSNRAAPFCRIFAVLASCLHAANWLDHEHNHTHTKRCTKLSHRQLASPASHRVCTHPGPCPTIDRDPSSLRSSLQPSGHGCLILLFYRSSSSIHLAIPRRWLRTHATAPSRCRV